MKILLFALVIAGAAAVPAKKPALVAPTPPMGWATGRPIVFSLCERGNNKPWEWGPQVGRA